MFFHIFFTFLIEKQQYLNCISFSFNMKNKCLTWSINNLSFLSFLFRKKKNSSYIFDINIIHFYYILLLNIFCKIKQQQQFVFKNKCYSCLNFFVNYIIKGNELYIHKIKWRYKLTDYRKARKICFILYYCHYKCFKQIKKNCTYIQRQNKSLFDVCLCMMKERKILSKKRTEKTEMFRFCFILKKNKIFFSLLKHTQITWKTNKGRWINVFFFFFLVKSIQW